MTLASWISVEWRRSMRRRETLACAALLAACGAPRAPGLQGPGAADADCDALVERLQDERSHEVNVWAAEAEAARVTERFDANAVLVQGRGITRAYFARFEELAALGCGRAKLELLDSLAHLEPFDPERVGASLALLREVVREEAGAWWIADAADSDVLRYFLLGAGREDAIALYEELITTTPDDGARRALLLELGLARLRNPASGEREAADRAAALAALDRVAREWPGTQEAVAARERLGFERELVVGRPMPALEGSDVDGARLRLADLRGRVVVVDFFGFWCAPCVAALPRLKDLAARHAPRDLALLGVNAYDSEEAFRRGRERHGLEWPCLFDGPQGSLSRALGVMEFPVVFVLDREGVIRAKNPGPEQLADLVGELVRGE